MTGKVLLATLVLVIGLFLLNSLAAPEAQTSGFNPSALLTAPRVIDIAPSAEIDIAAGSIYRYEWEVPSSQPLCHVTGRIEVLSGGNKDVQVFLLDADEYKNLENGHKFSAYVSTDPTTVHILDARVRRAGKMVLAVGNQFSVVTSKRVRFSGVRATCT